MLNDIYLNFNATLYAFEGYELPLIGYLFAFSFMIILTLADRFGL